MTVHILHFSSNKAEKQKIKNIQYPSYDLFEETEEPTVQDILKIIEFEENHKDALRLA